MEARRGAGPPAALRRRDLDELRAALLGWGAAARRDLPWRRTRDPWAVLVSELMLQQTQVARVVPRYGELLDRFPTPAACAAAPAGEVVRAWAGLGYNRRALNLHRAATEVTERWGGRLPDDLDALLSLRGIGQYTARAVLAFAFERDVGVLDTNAARVLARLSGHPLKAKEAQAGADALVPAGEAWAWNQAMLDLGATVCVARRPRCDRCPVATWCGWRSAGLAGADPATGSAGVPARQSPFTGSDREGRGRLLDALRSGPVGHREVAACCGWPDDPQRAGRIAAQLIAEGFAVATTDALRLC